MHFLNETKLEDILNKEVDVFLPTPDGLMSQIPLCRVFEKDGVLRINFHLKSGQDVSVEIPEDSIVSRNETELSIGRIGLFLHPDSEAWSIANSFLQNRPT